MLQTLNRQTSRGTLQLLLLCGVRPILNVFTEIIKINHKTIKHIIVYEIYVTVEVIKSTKGFLNALKSLGGSAAMLIISRQFSTIKFC